MEGKLCKFSFRLPPAGSLLLYLRAEGAPSEEEELGAPQTKLSSAPKVARLDPNVLVIDYVDITLDGEKHEKIYFFEAQQLIFRKYGLRGNPWDRSIQFRDEIIRKRFPPDSGFEATYRFVIEGSVPSDLSFVLESPGLYTITCNGKRVVPTKGAWWLDRSFGVIPIAECAQIGENFVTIRAQPLTVFHELEPAYVLGSFSLKESDSGFTIVPEKRLGLGSWRKQGLCLYGHRVKYTERVEVPAFRKCILKLGRWYGSVAKVKVNGKDAGYIAFAPWELDVSDLVKVGPNEVSVIVFGTLKNTLGPHHGNPSLGSAWPAMFVRAPKHGPPPGSSYSTADYGLFEPFVLEVYQ
mgnify:CR=1 FL=1